MVARWVIVLLCLVAGTASAELRVVTTIAPITDLVTRVAGPHVQVRGIVPEGTDSHTFEPAPSTARLLAAADLVIANGLDLEASILALAATLTRPGTPIVRLGDLALHHDEWRYDPSFPVEHGRPNPHLWPNVLLAMRYVDLVRDALLRIDPGHAADYRSNSVALMARLSRLDAAIFDCVASIPAGQRQLVTYHDSFAYFAPRYGMTVIRALQPSDFGEPSAREVARLIDQLRELRVPAMFGSRVFPSPVLERVARDSGTRYVDELRDDDLPGAPGDPDHSYIGMMRANVRLITEALGGDPDCLAGAG